MKTETTSMLHLGQTLTGIRDAVHEAAKMVTAAL